jgi:hypothetical protein
VAEGVSSSLQGLEAFKMMRRLETFSSRTARLRLGVSFHTDNLTWFIASGQGREARLCFVSNSRERQHDLFLDHKPPCTPRHGHLVGGLERHSLNQVITVLVHPRSGTEGREEVETCMHLLSLKSNRTKIKGGPEYD